MCGIVYKHNFNGDPVNDSVFDQYYSQRNRGVEGFGIYDGQELNMMHTTTEDKMVKWLSKYKSNMLLLHHRYPTSTVNVKKAAHPFSTKKHFGNREYILVHNGVMKNHKKMFVAHQELGIEYKSFLDDLTFNDSEALLWDFALTMEGKQDKMESIGRIAFICLLKVDGVLTHMFFGRNSSPLNLVRTHDTIELSSEGKGDSITSNTLYTWDYAKKSLTTEPMTFTEFEPYTGRSVYEYSRPYALSRWEEEMEEEDYKRSWTGRAGDWLDDTLRHKYRKLLKHMDANKVMEFEEDEDGAYVPASDFSIEFSDNEVELATIEYLEKYKGHFEEAYWAVELDYEDLQSETDTFDTIKQRALLERVLDSISNDPEYLNENSVSSIWEALWSQPQTA